MNHAKSVIDILTGGSLDHPIKRTVIWFEFSDEWYWTLLKRYATKTKILSGILPEWVFLSAMRPTDRCFLWEVGKLTLGAFILNFDANSDIFNESRSVPVRVWDDILTPLYIDPGVNISYDILTPGSIYRNNILTPLTIFWPPLPIVYKTVLLVMHNC